MKETVSLAVLIKNATFLLKKSTFDFAKHVYFHMKEYAAYCLARIVVGRKRTITKPFRDDETPPGFVNESPSTDLKGGATPERESLDPPPPSPSQPA